MCVDAENRIFLGMEIRDIHISGRSVLAPLAGVADNAFRLMAKEGGASMVFSELISADGLVRDSEKTYRLMKFYPEERPIGIQLFGNDPDILAEAVCIVESIKPDVIDLNFGCPAKKVVRRGAGAALMRDLPKMRAIAQAVVRKTSFPVSAKIRSGWHENEMTAVDASRILEDAGVCWIAVHGRTGKMGFRGQADWGVIRDVKSSVSIPVIGNGDVKSPEDAKRMFDMTGCDLVMIGRGALGRPWLFDRIDHFLQTGKLKAEPSFRERIDICLRHYERALHLLGEERGVKEMRKHIGWYLKGMPMNSQIKQSVFLMNDPERVTSTLKEYSNRLELKILK